MARGIPYARTPTEARCPACLNDRGEVLYAVTSEQSAQHSVVREANPERHDALRAHIEHLWGGATCRLVACTRCGFTFADPFVSGDHRFFDLAYEREGYPAWRWEFDVTRRVLRDAYGAEGLRRAHLLELGAGDGAFARAVVPADMPAEHVLCTEFSDYGLRTIRAAGIAAVDGDVRALGPEHDGRFDVVCMFQIMEHLDDFDGLFARLGTLTKPAAHVFVTVPNGRRVEFNERHGSLLDMPPNHTGRWTRGAFEALAARTGWAVADHRIEPEGALSKARELMTYTYMRNRQEGGTVENRVAALPKGPVRRALQIALAASNGVRRAPEIAEMIRRPDIGGTQWAHLTRSAA